MIKLGCHLSSAAGFTKMAQTAVDIGANTFQFFLRNPRGGAAKEILKEDALGMEKILTDHHFSPVLAHSPYTLNLASGNPNTRAFAKEILADDLKRMEQIPCRYYNIHPGSHTTLTKEEGIEEISSAINEVLHKDTKSMILLETMSGKGSEIGSNFQDLREIIERIHLKEKMGVCLDTCHLFAAGYDIVNQLEVVFHELEREVGLERVKMIHFNDSLMPFASHKDRHAGIGLGEIGLEALLCFLEHPQVRGIPFILETPYDAKGHEEEIIKLREMIKNRQRL